MRALLVALMVLAAGPVWADVIPSRYSDEAPVPQGVAERFGSLGLGASEIERRWESLSPEAQGFFGSDPRRLQSAAQLYHYEWLGAGLLVAGLTGSAYALYNHTFDVED